MQLNQTAELPLFKADEKDRNVQAFRRLLHRHGWMTRKQIVEATGWCERVIRAYAEALGSEVVRGQRGFKLTEDLEDHEIGDALNAAESAISQARIQTKYGIALKQKLHARLNRN